VKEAGPGHEERLEVHRPPKGAVVAPNHAVDLDVGVSVEVVMSAYGAHLDTRIGGEHVLVVARQLADNVGPDPRLGGVPSPRQW
jgi:hypothetical protein